MGTKWIYVLVGEDLRALPDVERHVREIVLPVMRHAGIADPDIETRAAPHSPSAEDEDEEEPRNVRVEIRFTGEDDIAIGDVVRGVRTALLAAGFASFDPGVDSN
jgi:hypothetical protein